MADSWVTVEWCDRDHDCRRWEYCAFRDQRVLDPGSYVLIEKVGAVPHWPERVIEDLSDTITLEGVYRLLDALAGGEG